jgi:hypothetical protein
MLWAQGAAALALNVLSERVLTGLTRAERKLVSTHSDA